MDLFPKLIPNISENLLGLPGDHVIDMYLTFGGKETKYPELIFDGLHPNTEGYKKMAELVYDTINSQGN